MQFKLGKHMQPADMMRQEGERAARKSQRRNAFRELKNFGKHADEERKKLEGQNGPPDSYSERDKQIWRDEHKGEGRGGTPPAGHHSAAYWQSWAKQEHKSDTAAKNEYSQGENAIERKIPSESTPGKEYRVWGEKGNMHCSCPSFTYRNTCKHVQSLGEEGPKRKLKYGRNYYYPSK
jgi:hypothetical protein